MKMKKHVLSVVVFGLSLCLLPGVSWGAVDIDITFSPGATPTDVGMSSQGDPGAAGLLNTGAGSWDVSLGSGDSAFWAMAAPSFWDLTTATSITNNFTDAVIHGTAEITHASISGSGVDLTLIRLADDNGGALRDYEMELRVQPDEIVVVGKSAQGISDVSIPVITTLGVKHDYGWELDRSTNKVRIFFNGTEVSAAGGLTVPTGTELQGYFGDGGSDGTHVEQWDRYTIGDGAFVIPEPTTLFLLVQAAALALFIRRRRSC